MSTPQPIPEPTLRRLPRYARLLKAFARKEHETVSSRQIADLCRLDPTQVRKDLACTGAVGRPRIGFQVSELIDAIEICLGWRNHTDSVLVGVGHLGTALLGYDGFMGHGLRIIGVFDANPALLGHTIHGHEIRPMERLEAFIARLHINLGVLTVPAPAAQQVAERMVDAGVKAIWNFAPVTLSLPEDIIVEEEQIYASLAVLSRRLEVRLRRPTS